MTRPITPADVLPVAVAAGLVIPLDSFKTMPRRFVTEPLTFTVGAKANGGQCVLPLVADGASAVVFQGFTEAGWSSGWNNTAGILNMVSFFYLDGTPYFSVSQAVGVQPITAPVNPATGYSLSGPSTGVVGTASSNFTLRTNGSTSAAVTFTPSDGGKGGTFTPNTVQIAASNAAASATFKYTPAAAGSVSIGVTDNGGLTDPSPVAMTVAAAPTTNFVRLPTTDSLAETAASGGGYTYTRTTDNGFNGGYGVSAVAIPSGADGWFAMNAPTPSPYGLLFGLKFDNAVSTAYSDLNFGIYMDTNGGNTAYKSLGKTGGGSAGATVNGASGDIARVGRFGTTVLAQVSQDGGTTWQTVATWTGVATGPLYAMYNVGNKAAPLVKPFASSNVA